MPLNILEHFSTLKDPRRNHPNKLHKLIDIVVISICAMLAKCETWDEIADYALERQDFFQEFLELPNGIPSHDTINRVFASVDPSLWQQCFCSWMQSVTTESAKKIKQIQIDGKTLCGTKSSGTGKREVKQTALQMVTAWASEQQLVLAQTAVEGKSNEITAIPDLLQMLDLERTIVSIDAMGAQTKIAEQIVEQGGDYILGLKGNQATLHQAAQDLFEDTLKTSSAQDYAESFDVGHGRQEERKCWVLKDLRQFELADCRVETWVGLKSVIVIEAVTTRKGKISSDRRYYLSSLDCSPEQGLSFTRGHWSIENQATMPVGAFYGQEEHYVLDVLFREDVSRARRGFAAQNLGLMRRLVLNLLNLDMGLNVSKRRKRLRAMLNDAYLLSLIGLSFTA